MTENRIGLGCIRDLIVNNVSLDTELRDTLVRTIDESTRRRIIETFRDMFDLLGWRAPVSNDELWDDIQRWGGKS
jgi:hypothetical protein